MRIVHLTSVHARRDTRIFLKECTSLVRSGYETTLIVADGNGDERAEDGVEIVDVGPAPKSRLGRMFIVPWKMLIATWYRRPVVAHIHDPELIPVAILMGIFVQKIVFDMHENVPKQILEKHWIRPFARKPIAWVYAILERLALNRFNVVLAEHSYADDYPWLRNSVTILNLPVIDSMPKADPEEKYPCFTVGYIGGCTEERGIVTVATAISMLRARGMEVQFDCIGPLNSDVLANP